MSKYLPGTVALVTAGTTNPDVSTVEHHIAIVQAAMAYVVALRAWNEHVAALRRWPEKTAFTNDRRARLHRARKALVTAVDTVAASDPQRKETT